MKLDGHLFGAGQPCFGCGPDHPIGFHLAFERDGDAIVTRFTPGPQYQGPPGLMHGGLIFTLADELGAWTILGLKGKFGFTTSFDGRVARGVKIGVEVVGRGTIARDTRRLVDVAVSLSQDGVEAYTGTLRFALVDRAAAEKLLGGPIPEAWERFCR
jgi:acyl-coenzyme A thioesterase PaaI-like protein